MTLAELKASLTQHPDLPLRFLLPDGNTVPAHAHVTEVARIDKRFVDCGGTLRTDRMCRLQIWVADDLDHRLKADKLLRILGKATSVLQSDDLEVDIEYEAAWISQFPVKSVEPRGDALVVCLTSRHTACLAEDKCKSPAPGLSAFNPQAINFRPILNRS
jgi:hypothetical protein